MTTTTDHLDHLGLHELGLLLPIERWLTGAAPWEMKVFLLAALHLVEEELNDRDEHDVFRLVAASPRRTHHGARHQEDPVTATQLGLFDAPPSPPRPPARKAKAELRRELAGLRSRRVWWLKGCPGGHVDYGLLPGTDEGDAAAAFRRLKAAELEGPIAVLVDQLHA